MRREKQKIILMVVLLSIFLMSVNFAYSLESMFSDKGSNVKANGVLVSNGNLTIEIRDESLGLVYFEDYLSSINNGSWNVFLGYN